MKTLMDIAMADKKLNNLVPFALSRENSEGYYYLVAQQARFIENRVHIGSKIQRGASVAHQNPCGTCIPIWSPSSSNEIWQHFSQWSSILLLGNP